MAGVLKYSAPNRICIQHIDFSFPIIDIYSVPHTTPLDGACVGISGSDGLGACGSGRGRLTLGLCVEAAHSRREVIYTNQANTYIHVHV